MTIEKFLGTYAIRDLSENEVYFCQEGCGECSKVVVEEDNRTMHSPNETILLERDYSKLEVSSCCKSEVGIWNNDTDEEVKAEYVFTQHEEGEAGSWR
ncbi:hypothetical protein D0812_21920 [Vibrio owensii]|uniref:Uncharacterized protein n=1 Tax=Vibrio owensii TaxID=696485 RepID=A0AAP9KC35_9VIBR|nr:hypothetical protein [Vibrio owensii]AYO17048.1 hypothetical protein D0812_21920 [Vibrio owensii]QGH49197.1 hypothetical protein APZ19_18945 [Vibrio owensii]